MGYFWQRESSRGLHWTSCFSLTKIQKAFFTSPDRKHRVQTWIRLTTPSTSARTFWRLGRKTRFVLLLEWLTLCPVIRFFPQTEHANAIISLLTQKFVPDGLSCYHTPSHSDNFFFYYRNFPYRKGLNPTSRPCIWAFPLQSPKNLLTMSGASLIA